MRRTRSAGAILRVLDAGKIRYVFRYRKVYDRQGVSRMPFPQGCASGLHPLFQRRAAVGGPVEARHTPPEIEAANELSARLSRTNRQGFTAWLRSRGIRLLGIHGERNRLSKSSHETDVG